MVMCGTPNKCRAFFADAESGLVSRVTPVVLPDMVGAKMPQFKLWTKDEEERVKRQCLCLMDEEGEVDLPLINKAIEAWDEEKRQEYLQTLRYSLDVLRRRAALNGFRAGIIAYLLEGRKETERAIKFALWYAERCFYYQLQIYGDKIDALIISSPANTKIPVGWTMVRITMPPLPLTMRLMVVRLLLHGCQTGNMLTRCPRSSSALLIVYLAIWISSSIMDRLTVA